MTRPDQQATAVGGEALNGRYEIIAPISSGAMGAVYRATDRESGQDVAVKRLLDGDGIGPATDIYGLACLACETLTGTVPYSRDTDAATMYAHIVDPPPSVCERRPGLPAAFDDILATGMAKDPDERPDSAGALVVDMLRALGMSAPACLSAAG